MADRTPRPDPFESNGSVMQMRSEAARRELAAEIAEAFTRYVSPTARLLEWPASSVELSLHLARTGFRITQLCPSEAQREAHARAFHESGLDAQILCGDPFEPPADLKRHDLVWNFGVLDHYDDERSVDLLRTMRRLSRQHVAAVVPNGRSLAYWLDRYDRVRHGRIEYNPPPPIVSLRPLFRAAGVKIHEEGFPGSTWTVEQLEGLPGITPELVGFLRETWQQHVITPEQNALLLAVGQRSRSASRGVSLVRMTPTQRLQRQVHELIDTCGKIAHARDEAEAQAREQLAALERCIDEVTEALQQRTAELEKERHRAHDLTRQLARQQFNALTEAQQRLNERDQRIEALRREHDRLLASVQTERDALQRNLRSRLEAAAYQLHRAEQMRTVKLAQFFRRVDSQLAHGTRDDRRAFAQWLRRRIRRQPTAADPRFDLFDSLRKILEPLSDLPTIGDIRPNETPKESAAPPRPPYDVFTNTRARYRESAPRLRTFYGTAHLDAFPSESLDIRRRMQSVAHHGIVVFPPALPWEPWRRPHHLLRAFAERGLLCLFCEPTAPDSESMLEEIQPRLFRVRREEFLLPILRHEAPLVLCTSPLQRPFADALPHAQVWYDIDTPIERMPQYDARMRDDHERLLRDAAMVSYTARTLLAGGKDDKPARDDAVCVPNAAWPDDFRRTPDDSMPEGLESWHRRGVPLIGFAGVLTADLDYKLLEHMAERRPEWDFVLVGPAEAGVPVERFRRSNLRHIADVTYAELPEYLARIDVVALPYRVTQQARVLSPVACYEALAAGKPIVSTPIDEMRPFARDFIHLADGADAFARAVDQGLRDGIRAMAARHGPVLVEQHTWSRRAAAIERAWEHSFDALSTRSPLTHERQVPLYSPTFLATDGDAIIRGGSSGQIIDLAKSLTRIGHRLTVYQHGHAPWVRRIGDVEVRSLFRSMLEIDDPSVDLAGEFNRLFYNQLAGRAGLYLYDPMSSAFPKALHPNIGVSHGITWDDPAASFSSGLDFWAANRQHTESLSLCDVVVAPDGHVANWFQTIDFQDSGRIRVIPPGVDTTRFAPSSGPSHDAGNAVILLFPRRLVESRGLYMLLDVADELLEQHDALEVRFAGDGVDADCTRLRQWVHRWPERARWDRLDPDDMPAAYRSADITVVPTVYGGSSQRACLEAMACGNAVVATRVGGASSLIVDGYNGLLVEAQADALRAAIVRLIEDAELRQRLGRNARATAKTLTHERWDEAWRALWQRHLVPADAPAPMGRLALVEVPNTNVGTDVLGWVLARLLEHGDLVYVLDHDDGAPVRRSFGRLQWIRPDEVKFARPDVWVLDTALHAAASAVRPHCWIRLTAADPWPEPCHEPVIVGDPSPDRRGRAIRTREALEALGLASTDDPSQPSIDATVRSLAPTRTPSPTV